jgi:peptide-methionine (S)-S-oxide reductase
VCFEHHDPTQATRQGNDIGTPYCSAIYVADEAQLEAAERTRDRLQAVLEAAGDRPITTDIVPVWDFFYAEGHRQYLAANPNG